MIIEQLSKQPEKEKKRVRLTVAYDGTNYHGWQIQNNGITIESELNRCLTDLLQEPVEVIGASRTDSGVHALGNYQPDACGENFLCTEPETSGGYPDTKVRTGAG